MTDLLRKASLRHASRVYSVPPLDEDAESTSDDGGGGVGPGEGASPQSASSDPDASTASGASPAASPDAAGPSHPGTIPEVAVENDDAVVVDVEEEELMAVELPDSYTGVLLPVERRVGLLLTDELSPPSDRILRRRFQRISGIDGAMDRREFFSSLPSGVLKYPDVLDRVFVAAASDSHRLTLHVYLRLWALLHSRLASRIAFLYHALATESDTLQSGQVLRLMEFALISAEGAGEPPAALTAQLRAMLSIIGPRRSRGLGQQREFPVPLATLINHLESCVNTGLWGLRYVQAIVFASTGTSAHSSWALTTAESVSPASTQVGDTLAVIGTQSKKHSQVSTNSLVSDPDMLSSPETSPIPSTSASLERRATGVSGPPPPSHLSFVEPAPSARLSTAATLAATHQTGMNGSSSIMSPYGGRPPGKRLSRSNFLAMANALHKTASGHEFVSKYQFFSSLDEKCTEFAATWTANLPPGDNVPTRYIAAEMQRSAENRSIEEALHRSLALCTISSPDHCLSLQELTTFLRQIQTVALAGEILDPEWEAQDAAAAAQMIFRVCSTSSRTKRLPIKDVLKILNNGLRSVLLLERQIEGLKYGSDILQLEDGSSPRPSESKGRTASLIESTLRQALETQSSPTRKILLGVLVPIVALLVCVFEWPSVYARDLLDDVDATPLTLNILFALPWVSGAVSSLVAPVAIAYYPPVNVAAGFAVIAVGSAAATYVGWAQRSFAILAVARLLSGSVDGVHWAVYSVLAPLLGVLPLYPMIAISLLRVAAQIAARLYLVHLSPAMGALVALAQCGGALVLLLLAAVLAPLVHHDHAGSGKVHQKYYALRSFQVYLEFLSLPSHYWAAVSLGCAGAVVLALVANLPMLVHLADPAAWSLGEANLLPVVALATCALLSAPIGGSIARNNRALMWLFAAAGLLVGAGVLFLLYFGGADGGLAWAGAGLLGALWAILHAGSTAALYFCTPLHLISAAGAVQQVMTRVALVPILVLIGLVADQSVDGSSQESYQLESIGLFTIVIGCASVLHVGVVRHFDRPTGFLWDAKDQGMDTGSLSAGLW